MKTLTPEQTEKRSRRLILVLTLGTTVVMAVMSVAALRIDFMAALILWVLAALIFVVGLWKGLKGKVAA